MSSSGKDQDPLRDWTFLRDLFLKLVFHLILLVMILLFVIILDLVPRKHPTQVRDEGTDRLLLLCADKGRKEQQRKRAAQDQGPADLKHASQYSCLSRARSRASASASSKLVTLPSNCRS